MPEELALPRAHRRIEEAVSEASALVGDLRRVLELVARRTRAIEQKLVVARPDLGISRHRLAVQAEVVGIRREERHGDLVRERAVSREPFVAGDALPAMRARDVRDDPVAVRVLRRIVLVEPARLRNADLVALLAARKEVEERDLRRTWKRGGEATIQRVLVEQERRGAGD